MTQNSVQNGCNGHEKGPGRLDVEYVNKSQRFILPAKHDYNRQFHNLYVARCEVMLGLLREKVQQKWGTQYPIRKIHDLNDENQEKCVIIGTIFKQQVLKPSVLKELAKVTHIMPQPIAPSFTDDSDVVMLEDELQRVRLFGNIVPHDVVTGIMCAVLGHILEQGRFHVDEILFYECGPQESLKTLDNSPSIVLISGLNMTHADNLAMPLEILQQWLFGNWFGGSGFDPQSVVRVIVAGNSVKTEDNRVESLDMEQQATAEDVNGIRAVDKFLEQLSQSVNVDLMPGEYDPTSSLLPQQPIHMLLLPKCSKLKTCQSVPNPYACEIAGRSILGMSGQNVDDIVRYSQIPDALAALKATFRWGHIVPTCPDTKFAYPMRGNDPFVIEDCPHIYFTGNCPKYQTELLKDAAGRKVRLICVPKFYETKSIVVVNLANLECKLMMFQTE
ncbi:DNA polymerase delta subunit 2 [Lutzomyia longipalpis]|uniref:DNA polymerase delta subunit 2 n=1 Tax=Lutzomyia longipalpis TaxID=7200 RepID=UPI002483907E|nr:DNA polymerase delta subunit 2 [Lutzomyia longipalpis]